MARTEAELRAHLVELGPWWLREPDEVMEAVLEAYAALFAEVERITELAHDRTFIGDADGAWLDAHGRERAIYRGQGETDAEYAPRIQDLRDAVTIPAILAALNLILLVTTPAAYIEECQLDGLYLSDEGSGLVNGFLDNTALYGDVRCFVVYIPYQLPNKNLTAFLVAEGQPGPESFLVEDTGDGFSPDDPGMFVDQTEPTKGDIYARIYDLIDALRAAGVTFTVIVQ